MEKLKNVWINGDCLKELTKLDAESVDMVITSPPYHNLRVYSNDPTDLSNCETYEEYYYLLGLVIEECHRVFKKGGKFVIQFEDYNYTLGRDGKRGFKGWNQQDDIDLMNLCDELDKQGTRFVLSNVLKNKVNLKF